MKTLFLLLVLIASLGQANAASTKTVEQIQIEITLAESSADKKAEYAACLAETPDDNCVNEVLGDIWN